MGFQSENAFFKICPVWCGSSFRFDRVLRETNRETRASGYSFLLYGGECFTGN